MHNAVGLKKKIADTAFLKDFVHAGHKTAFRKPNSLGLCAEQLFKMINGYLDLSPDGCAVIIHQR